MRTTGTLLAAFLLAACSSTGASPDEGASSSTVTDSGSSSSTGSDTGTGRLQLLTVDGVYHDTQLNIVCRLRDYQGKQTCLPLEISFYAVDSCTTIGAAGDDAFQAAHDAAQALPSGTWTQPTTKGAYVYWLTTPAPTGGTMQPYDRATTECTSDIYLATLPSHFYGIGDVLPISDLATVPGA